MSSDMVVVDLADLAPPPGQLPADKNPALVYLGPLAPASRATMRAALQLVADLVTGGGTPFERFPWWQLRFEHTRRLSGMLAERYAPRYVAKIQSALRGVFHCARRLGLMDAEAAAAASDMKPPRGSRVAPGRMIDPAEVAALLAATTRPGPIGARDRALVTTLLLGGLRRQEVAALDVGRYDRHARTLTVRGKGNKERLLPVHAALAAALAAWLEVRGASPGPLFCHVVQGSVDATARLTPQGVYAVVKKVVRRASLAQGLSPHDFRRTFISNLLDKTGDLAAAGRLAGHAKIETTHGYDRRGERAARAAVDALELPRDA